MSLKYVIFKICPKLAENDIHVKQESVPQFLGTVGDKKWSPFLDLGIRNPIFVDPKTAILGAKKWDFGCPHQKNGDHFFSPTIPKIGGIDSCFT